MKSFCKISINLLFISFLLGFAFPVFANETHPCDGRQNRDNCVEWYNQCMQETSGGNLCSLPSRLDYDYPLVENSDTGQVEIVITEGNDIHPKIDRVPASNDEANPNQYICDTNPNLPFCQSPPSPQRPGEIPSYEDFIPKNPTETAEAQDESQPENTQQADTEETAPEQPQTQPQPRNVASSINIGNLGSCDSPTLNTHCSTSSQDGPTFRPDSDTLRNEIDNAKEDAAALDLAGADPYDKAQFNCRDSLEHEKSGADFVCNNPVKALGGPVAQAVRFIGQYGSIGAGLAAMSGKESLNKLCTTIAMLSATGVGIGVAARKKCNGKIKRCQNTCDQEKTQICTAYQAERAKCFTVQNKLKALQATSIFTGPAAIAFAQQQQEVLRIHQQRITTYQEKVSDIESVKRECKKLEANIAGMGQDILNMVMTLGSAKACRDATGGKYTSDIDNCEERGGQVVTDPLGNMICHEPKQKCTTTSECPNNEMCMNGVCQAITGMCPDGSLKACSENCDNGEAPANCPKTGTCSDGTVKACSENCDNGAKPANCPPETGTCSDGTVKACSENCEDGTKPQGCESNNSTTSPDQCPDPSLTYPNCNCDCPTGQLCNPDTRQCIGPDSTDDDATCPDPSMTYPDCDCNCPEGQTCDSQRKCVKEGDDGKGDCPNGSRIACDQNCTDGSKPTGCRSCNGDSDCGDNQICNRGVCVSEDPVLENQDGVGGGGAPISEMGDELAITNDGMGGGEGNQRNPSGNPLSGLGGELPDAAQLGGSGGSGGGYGAGGSSGGSGGGGGFFSRLFGGRKGKSKGKGVPMPDESGATVKGAGGGGFGGYGGGGRRKGGGKLALNKKQIKKLKKEKGAKRTLPNMKDGLGGAHHDIFERVTKRFTHLCKNKLNCR